MSKKTTGTMCKVPVHYPALNDSENHIFFRSSIGNKKYMIMVRVPLMKDFKDVLHQLEETKLKSE